MFSWYNVYARWKKPEICDKIARFFSSLLTDMPIYPKIMRS